MVVLRRVSLVLSVVALFVACDEEDPLPISDAGVRDAQTADSQGGVRDAGPADSSTLDVEVSDADVSVTRLSANSAVEVTFLGGEHASDEEVFSIVRLRIENDFLTPIPIQPPFFSVLLTTGIQLTASPLSAALENPCPMNGMLAAGRSTECEVAFLIDAEIEEDAVIFADEDGETLAEVPYPERQEFRCGEGYLSFADGTPSCEPCPEDGTCDGRSGLAPASPPDFFFSFGVTQSCTEMCAMMDLSCERRTFPLRLPACAVDGDPSSVACDFVPLQNACDEILCACE